jgi:hypothetical protein
MPTVQAEIFHGDGESDVVVTFKCSRGPYEAAVLYEQLVAGLKSGGMTLNLSNWMGGQEYGITEDGHRHRIP